MTSEQTSEERPAVGTGTDDDAPAERPAQDNREGAGNDQDRSQIGYPSVQRRKTKSPAVSVHLEWPDDYQESEQLLKQATALVTELGPLLTQRGFVRRQLGQGRGGRNFAFIYWVEPNEHEPLSS